MKTTYPLSQSQYGIYVECMNNLGQICYNNGFHYQLDGSLDGQKLRKAIETTFKAHPTYFTRIGLNENNEPIQFIDLSEEWTLALEQTTDFEKERGTFIQPYNLHEDRLFRVRLLQDANYFHLFVDLHHIISDGTTFQLLLHEFEQAYYENPLAPEQKTMGEHALEEEARRLTPEWEEGKQWYASNFDCSETFTQLAPDLEVKGRAEGNLTHTMEIPLEQVDAFCKEKGIYKSNLFTMAYAFLLAKYNNEQESFFTTAYNGRNDKRLTNTVGMFVKTLPVYAKFHADTTVLEFLQKGQEQMSGCRKHDIYSFMDFMHDIAPQYNSTFAWHGMLFNNYNEQLMGKPMKTNWLLNGTLGVSLYVKAFIEDGHFKVNAEYNANEYSEALISNFLESYEKAVSGLLTQEYLRDISLTNEKQLEILDSFNQTDKEYDDTQTIVSLFRQRANEMPDQLAVVFKDKQYTYRQVDEITNRIAAYIASKGIQAGEAVSILIPRCEWMGIAPLGVMKAGCAYQPLDPTYPKERLNFMMQDADVKLLIADPDLCSLVDEYQGEILLTCDLMNLPDAPAPDVTLSPESILILLYTSGSTGVPKGCQLMHKNLVAYSHWYHSSFDLKLGDRVSAYASFGFDASMMEVHCALTGGATSYIIPEEIRLDLIALNNYMEEVGITHGFMTTQVAYQFASNIENHSLRHLLTGGEKLASLTPPQGYQLHNLYGPTETTCCVTHFPVKDNRKEILIGKAMDNNSLYIVDTNGHRLPIGASGELWVSGPQVGHGYLNRPEKTQEVFINNPFTNEEKYARIYRTGDIVRYLPSGDIQFMGRRDGQVKIRGYRIELKEVESIIREFPGIKDATVQAFDEEGGGKFIAAYIVSDQTIDIMLLPFFRQVS